MQGPFDIAVVGAGAAGLGAARAAMEAGASVVVLEAANRIGGRAWTDSTTFGFPWDLGCHWLHSADVNHLTTAAGRYGIRYRVESANWHVRMDGRDLDRDQMASLDRYHEAVMAAINTAPDIPVASLLDPDSPWTASVRGGLAAEWAQDAELISAADIARYRDTGQNWPVTDGYGAIVSRSGAGIPVELATPVSRIDWSGPLARLETPRGVVSASTVVVTASTAAIAAGVIDFHPALPVAMREAFAALPCGRAEKVGIAVDGRALGVEDYTTIQYEPARAGSISFQLREDGRDFANAYLAGSICDDLDADGPGAMEACAVDALVDLIGSDVRRSIGTIRRTNWRAEPYILGSYASALPGHADARSVLRQPLGGRVWFAGEALHEEFFSTCHGADLDGRDAVLEALQAIRG